MYNETGNYLKIGLYRDKRAEAINSVYVDNAYIEASLNGRPLVDVRSGHRCALRRRQCDAPLLRRVRAARPAHQPLRLRARQPVNHRWSADLRITRAAPHSPAGKVRMPFYHSPIGSVDARANAALAHRQGLGQRWHIRGYYTQVHIGTARHFTGVAGQTKPRHVRRQCLR